MLTLTRCGWLTLIRRKWYTISVFCNKGFNLNFDTRITKGEKEVSKRRADIFFRLKQGEFITFADGKDRKIQFKLQVIYKSLPKRVKKYSDNDLQLNFERIYKEAQSIFNCNK